MIIILLSGLAYGETVLALFMDIERTEICTSLPVGEWWVSFGCYLIAKQPPEGFHQLTFKFVVQNPPIKFLGGSIFANGVPIEIWKKGANALYNGITIWYSPCQQGEWIVASELVFGTSCSGPMTPGCYTVTLGYHNTNGCCGFIKCGNTPIYEDADLVQGIYINCDPCPTNVGVKNSSWGAIKVMFK